MRHLGVVELTKLTNPFHARLQWTGSTGERYALRVEFAAGPSDRAVPVLLPGDSVASFTKFSTSALINCGVFG